MVDSTLTTDRVIESEAASTAAPVTGKARIQSIDTLRGVALLGILLMNIIAFANPFAAYLVPTVDGATSGANLATFMTVDIFFEGSMRAIFSMLFGAGMLIFLNKPNSEPEVVKSLYYRRTLLLVCFGLFNAYILVWLGDILYAYGMTGLLLYFFRHMEAKKLLLCSAAILVFLTGLNTSLHLDAKSLSSAAAEVQALPAGTELSIEQQAALEDYDAYLEQQFLAPELIEQQLEIMQSGYLDIVIFSATVNLILQTIGFIGNSFWDALAMMLLGMAFLKWGLLDASKSLKTYGLMVLIGLGIGLPLNTWETVTFVASGYSLEWTDFTRPTYHIGRMTLAIGYIGLVMLMCKLGFLRWLQYMLAKVGQMALTNYLSHSLICNFIFMGWGLGLAGQLERLEIYYVVFAIWLFQIIVSPLWLKYYRFGPAEWLWRSLTYGKLQPLRLQTT